MPNLTVRNIPKKEYAALRKDAERSGRSLNSGFLAMIHERSVTRRRRRTAMRQIDKLRQEIAGSRINRAALISSRIATAGEGNNHAQLHVAKDTGRRL